MIAHASYAEQRLIRSVLDDVHEGCRGRELLSLLPRAFEESIFCASVVRCSSVASVSIRVA